MDTPVGDIKPEKNPLVWYKNNENDSFSLLSSRPQYHGGRHQWKYQSVTHGNHVWSADEHSVVPIKENLKEKTSPSYSVSGIRLRVNHANLTGSPSIFWLELWNSTHNLVVISKDIVLRTSQEIHTCTLRVQEMLSFMKDNEKPPKQRCRWTKIVWGAST